MRYLKATLLCGAFAVLIAAGLFELGAFRALDSLLAALLGQLPPQSAGRGLQYACMVALGFGVAWTTIDITRPVLKIAVALIAFGEVLLTTAVIAMHGCFFSPFASLAAIVGAALIGLFYGQTDAGRRKRVLHQFLADRVSPRTFNALLDGDAPLKFDGDARPATVLVCEIFNHDALSAALDVEDYVAMANTFLRGASDFLVERGAYLDECDGESLRVVFGAPLPEPRHAAIACEAALDLATRLDEVNADCFAQWQQRVDFRIGVNTGEMVLAAYGTRRLGGFGAAGEAVEFTRRLCAANTIYGTRVLAGAGAFAEAEDVVEVRPMEIIQRHRDSTGREEVYELLSRRGALSSPEAERRDLFWKGIVLYREQKWDEAEAAFRRANAVCGEDAPSMFYIRRIEQLRAGPPVLEAGA